MTEHYKPHSTTHQEDKKKRKDALIEKTLNDCGIMGMAHSWIE